MQFNPVFQAVLSTLYIESTLVLTSLSLARISIPKPSACPRDRFPKKKIIPYTSNIQAEDNKILNTFVPSFFATKHVQFTQYKSINSRTIYLHSYSFLWLALYPVYLGHFSHYSASTNQNTGIIHEQFFIKGISWFTSFFYSAGCHFIMRITGYTYRISGQMIKINSFPIYIYKLLPMIF